ncbi:isoprenylcysteine carboxylmethyltransferase family protein [Devosia algicola]|uniref:Isoprenylcysteine carboxylmethyltransferase family protein n=1 Tax=Devosia algicola TaxID=3026418 RepID=A0ABY7YJF3_9HYPH|nr:isoprenylcysteine carboxylmethyltransferase family protein [Devosia algicola]WDR01406.1 isoprenylcysteine carboxylmethyltransferase family protein [Devosia algicola]
MTDEAKKDNPGVILFPPLILVTAMAVSLVLDFLVPMSFLPAPGIFSWLSWIGVVLFICGAGLAIVGSREFHRKGTNVDTRKPSLRIVDTGPYRYTRNPMYVGMVLGLAGFVLALSLEWGVLVWLIFIAILRYGVIAREERYLKAKFGAPYEALLKRTRRWV